MTQEKKTERDGRIDFLRGIGIITVIIGHHNVNTLTLVFIYAFHMQLFFMLSGYIADGNKDSFKFYVKKKATTLLYPYFVLGICIIGFNTLLDFFVKDGFSLTRTSKRVIALLYGNLIWENNIDYIGTLWFLVALFCCCLIWKVLCQIRNVYARTVMYCLIITFGYVVRLDFKLPWCLDVAFAALVYYILGSFVSRIDKLVKFKNWMLITVGIVLMFLGCIMGLLNGMTTSDAEMQRTDMLSMVWHNPVLYILAGSFISVGLFFLITLLYQKFRCIWIEYIGKYSLLIMVTHLYIKILFEGILARMGTVISVYLKIPLILVLSYGASFIIDRYFYRLYIFKKR